MRMNANTAAVSQGYIQGVIQSYNRSVMREGLRWRRGVSTGPAGPPGLARFSADASSSIPGCVSTWFLVTGLLGQLMMTTA